MLSFKSKHNDRVCEENKQPSMYNVLMGLWDRPLAAEVCHDDVRGL